MFQAAIRQVRARGMREEGYSNVPIFLVIYFDAYFSDALRSVVKSVHNAPCLHNAIRVLTLTRTPRNSWYQRHVVCPLLQDVARYPIALSPLPTAWWT